jgi:hypothetical protein
MKPTLKTFLLPMFVGFACCWTVGQAQEATLAYSDDFASVDGELTTNFNGTYEDTAEKTRDTFSYLTEKVEGGDLVLSILEDDETTGPDDKPGVLALKYDEVPKTSAEYSGFVYLGRTGEPIKLPNLKDNPGEAQLKQIKISFQYKAANPREDRVGATYNCRFEPDVGDAYLHRIDFGSLKATGKWRKFEQTLGRGGNRGLFIKAVRTSPDASFKLVWGQEGSITNYQDGDTLLIDDIKITITE